MNPDTLPRPKAAWRPWLLALSLWLLVAVITSLALVQLRSAALESQRREMALLSLALTDELDRGLRGAEDGLLALGLELGQRHLSLAGSETVQALQVRVALMPMVSTVWLLGRDGGLLASSDGTPLPDIEGFLPRLEALKGHATSMSRPFTRAETLQPHVALALRVPAAPGQPGGWIVASMSANKLLGAFGVALPAADARMAIFRRDGVRLAGSDIADVGDDVSNGSDDPPSAEPSGLVVRQFSDGSENLVGFHAVARYQLTVVVSRELTAVLEGWRGSLELSIAALGFLLVVIATAVHFVTRSERRQFAAQQALQVQLSRTSKLEALGVLAGGVSHDFNNVLAGIVGYGEMAQDAATPGSSQARHIGKVLQAAQRGKLLIERILSFSRGGARASVVFEFEPVVEEVLTLLSASLRPGVVLERVFKAPGARLRGDATQVFEAVMNLCTNALQAMPHGGMLSVQLERVCVTAPRVLSHAPLPVGDYLALSVSDQGSGITPDVMEHLFEPFFTARTEQTGTGLGLAVVFGVVAEFGGGIDVDSRPAQGARFTLYLPECTEALSPPGSTTMAAPAGRGQRVLVVDDEPALLALADEWLSSLGYAPVCFDNAQLALQALAEHPDRFDAVITDEVMPYLSGTAFTQALRELAPHVPVLMVSGYGGALLAQRASTAGVTRILMKPLQRGELARTLAELVR